MHCSLHCSQRQPLQLLPISYQNRAMSGQPHALQPPEYFRHCTRHFTAGSSMLCLAHYSLHPSLACCAFADVTLFLNMSTPQHAFALRTTGCRRLCKRLTHCSLLRDACRGPQGTICPASHSMRPVNTARPTSKNPMFANTRAARKGQAKAGRRHAHQGVSRVQQTQKETSCLHQLRYEHASRVVIACTCPSHTHWMQRQSLQLLPITLHWMQLPAQSRYC
jgi:hypothetical protein